MRERKLWGFGALAGAVVGFILRGPIYGAVPAACIGILTGLGVSLLKRGDVTDRWRSWRPWLAVGVSGIAALWWLRPPSAVTILEAHLELNYSHQVLEAKIFHRYGRDPFFGVRFVVDPSQLPTIARGLSAVEDVEFGIPRNASFDMFHPPKWWNPGELGDLAHWRSIDDGSPALMLWCDRQTGVCYLAVMVL